MSWLEELAQLQTDAVNGTLGTDLFVSNRATIPMLASGVSSTLSIVETSGSAPERTQNKVVKPAYIRPAAQFVARARDYDTARARAQAAYNAVVGIRNVWVYGPLVVGSGYYREITPLQEPFDMGMDDARGQARCGFNVIAIRRPD